MYYHVVSAALLASLARMCTQNCLSINVTGRQYLRPHSTQSSNCKCFQEGAGRDLPGNMYKKFFGLRANPFKRGS